MFYFSFVTGSKEEIWQRDGEVLRSAGEASQPLSEEEGVTSTRGEMWWNTGRLSSSCFPVNISLSVFSISFPRRRRTIRSITFGSISTRFLWSTSSRCRRSRRGRCLTSWSRWDLIYFLSLSFVLCKLFFFPKLQTSFDSEVVCITCSTQQLLTTTRVFCGLKALVSCSKATQC